MRWDWILRGFAAALVLTALLLLSFGEQSRLADDLQVAAPSSARPGEVIALRAFFFEHVDSGDGPALVSANVQARLLDASGAEVARARLASTVDGSAEGELRVPSHSRGAFWIEAALVGRAPALPVRLPLQIVADAPGLPLLGREAGPLQHLSLSRTKPVADARPPEPFLPRVPGGACTPGLRCELLVWLGEPPAALRLRVGPGVAQLTAPSQSEDPGVALAAVKVHGPEGQLTLEAVRGGHVVAERSVRLPVALGEASIELSSSLVEQGEPVSLNVTLPPGRKRGIVDVFAEGQRWRASRTLSVEGDARSVRLDPHWLSAGLMRVQVRASLFDSEGAGARLFYVRRAGEPISAVLRRIVERVRAASGDSEADWFDPAKLARLDPEHAVAFALTPLEEWRVQVPTPQGGRATRLAHAARRGSRVRYLVAAALVLAALLVGGALLVRGVSAATEAVAILERAQEEKRTHPSRPKLGFVVMFSIAVCLAFLLSALLIVAKPLWF